MRERNKAEIQRLRLCRLYHQAHRALLEMAHIANTQAPRLGIVERRRIGAAAAALQEFNDCLHCDWLLEDAALEYEYRAKEREQTYQERFGATPQRAN